MGRMALTKEQRRTEEAKKRKAGRIVQADNLKRQKAAEEQVQKQEVKAGRDALVEPEWHFMQTCVEAGRFDEADARVIPTQVLFQLLNLTPASTKALIEPAACGCMPGSVVCV